MFQVLQLKKSCLSSQRGYFLRSLCFFLLTPLDFLYIIGYSWFVLCIGNNRKIKFGWLICFSKIC